MIRHYCDKCEGLTDYKARNLCITMLNDNVPRTIADHQLMDKQLCAACFTSLMNWMNDR